MKIHFISVRPLLVVLRNLAKIAVIATIGLSFSAVSQAQFKPLPQVQSSAPFTTPLLHFGTPDPNWGKYFLFDTQQSPLWHLSG